MKPEVGKIYWHTVHGPVLVVQKWNDNESVCKKLIFNNRKALLHHALFEMRIDKTLGEVEARLDELRKQILKEMDLTLNRATGELKQ